MDELIQYFKRHRDIDFIGDIKWAHGVNSLELLEQAILNPAIDFLEIDISRAKNGDLIAAHYPITESNLTFDNLLERTTNIKKGIKLDFKDQDVIAPCLKKLALRTIAQPVILNADVLSIKNAPEAIISPEWFVDTCQTYYSRGILSPGWRTNPDPEAIYPNEDIDKMLALFLGIKNVTFNIRALMLPKSWEAVNKLIENNKYTLTIWETEPVSDELRSWIIQNTDKQKCFYDFS